MDLSLSHHVSLAIESPNLSQIVAEFRSSGPSFGLISQSGGPLMRCRGCRVMMDSVSNLETHCRKCVPCIKKVQAAGRATDRGESGFLPPAGEMVNASDLFRLLPRRELSRARLATPKPRPAHISSIARLPPLPARSSALFSVLDPSPQGTILDLSLSGFLSRVDSLIHKTPSAPEGGINGSTGSSKKKNRKKGVKDSVGQRSRKTPSPPGPRVRKRTTGLTRRPPATNQSRPSPRIPAPPLIVDQDVIFLRRKCTTSSLQSQSSLGVVQSTRSPTGIPGSSWNRTIHKESRRESYNQDSKREEEEEIVFIRDVAAPVNHSPKPLFPHDFSEAEVDDMFRR
jgi:hypothetical protein